MCPCYGYLVCGIRIWIVETFPTRGGRRGGDLPDLPSGESVKNPIKSRDGPAILFGKYGWH